MKETQKNRGVGALKTRPAIQKVVLALGGAVLLLFFQNCSKALEVKDVSDGFSLKIGGNGEGYGGKLDGKFATVDTRNVCGTATETQTGVRDLIEVKNGEALQLIENCQPLPFPRPVSLAGLQSKSADGKVLVLGDRVFQKGSWIDSGVVPRDQYVDVFCRGQDSQAPAPGQVRTIEVSISKDKETLHLEPPPPPPGAPDLPPPPAVDRYLRNGLLRLVDTSVSGETVVDREIAYPKIHENVLEHADGSTSHNLAAFRDSANPLAPIFIMNYRSLAMPAPFVPGTFNYGLPPEALRSARGMTCWLSH